MGAQTASPEVGPPSLPEAFVLRPALNLGGTGVVGQRTGDSATEGIRCGLAAQQIKHHPRHAYHTKEASLRLVGSGGLSW